MVRFYTGYWNRNRSVLLDGDFEARSPGANYPMLVGRNAGKRIIGLYADMVVTVDDGAAREIDVVNAKNTEAVVLAVGEDLGSYRCTIRDCRGRIVKSSVVRLAKGARDFSVPVSGLLTLERL
jgi:alpha-galactosidase